MTSKGNLKLGSSSEETPINTVQVPQPEESSHLTLPQSTWLSRLGINHRRSSMGFSMGTSMHELDEENSNSFSNAFSISKSTLGLETPIEGGAGAEGMTGGHFVQVTEDGKFKLEGYQIHTYDSSNTTSETLTDALGTAINVSEFPVATQESLAQLEEMKMRLNKSSDDVFDMDMEVDAIPTIVVDDSSPGPSRKTSREQQAEREPKPSKLLSNIMQSGFAQNWFFKGSNADEMSEDKSSVAPKTEEKFTSTAFMHDETENANFPFAFSGIEEGGGRKGMTKATAEKKKATLVEEQKQKREFRERNVFMPQNF